jgi:hypothetical protein
MWLPESRLGRSAVALWYLMALLLVRRLVTLLAGDLAIVGLSAVVADLTSLIMRTFIYLSSRMKPLT